MTEPNPKDAPVQAEGEGEQSEKLDKSENPE
jgi:hypothetical protein